MVVTSGTSTQPPSPLGATACLGCSPLHDDLGKKGVEPSGGVQQGLPESDPEQPMHAGAHMVLVLTTTLVHLAVLGSGALFASWRAEDQVSSARAVAEVSTSSVHKVAGLGVVFMTRLCECRRNPANLL